jgi:hypothetical protein
MVTQAELEQAGKASEDVKEVPDAPEIPPEVERAGVKPVATQFQGQVRDDSGKPLIQTPQSQQVTITLPTDQESLVTLSKGSVVNAVTWLAHFWLRMIKKAGHFGWRIVVRK